MAQFFYQRTTQFAETDAAGIIHFSNIARYAEEAEHAFLKQSGYPIEILNPKGYRWPRVKYKANYFKAILPFESLVVILAADKIGNTSITWKWTVFDSKQEAVFCNGEMKTICCFLNQGKMSSCSIPENLRQILLKD